MTASSSSGATLRRLPAYWFALRPALLGSAGWFGVAVTLTAFAIDPAVPDSYGTPKEYALLLVSAAALLLWATRIRAGGVLRVTALEAILAASLIWGFVVNPHWVAQREGNWFWPPLAGLILTLIVRQLCHPTDREEPPVGEPGSRLIGVGDFMIALSIVGSALAIHGLFQAVSAGSLRPADGSAKTTVVSIFGTPNGFGAFMAAGIIAALTAATQASRRPVRVLLVGAALLQLVALLGNGSRGAMLGLFAAGLSVLLLRVLRRRKGRGVVIAALGVPIVLALGGVLLNRLDPGSGRARLMAWEISGAMLSDRPLTGVGTGKFSVEYGRYQSELWRHPEYAEFDRQAVARPHPNSELFHRLAEQGVPGGFLYVLLWASALGLLLRVLTRAPGVSTLDWGLLALLVAILLHSLVDSALQWVPTLLTAHIAMGLIPAPALLRVELQRARARIEAAGCELRLLPSYASAHNNLGVALKNQNKLDEAAFHYKEAIRLDPRAADAHNNLGAVYFAQSKLPEAEKEYEAALRLRPNYPEAHNNLGVILKRRDRTEEEIAHYREAIRLRPDFAEAYNNLGYALLEDGRMQEAVDCYVQSIRIRPHYAEAHNNLAYIYTEMGKLDDALRHCQESLRLRPDYADGFANLGDLYKQGKYQFSDEDIQRMQALLARPGISDEDASVLHFTMAALTEKAKEYDAAFEHYRLGNLLRRRVWERQGRMFDAERCRKLFDSIIANFGPNYFRQVRSYGLDTELPVFIVGMPRSGTTLVEQILASHPQVHGAGELKYIQRAVLSLPKASSSGDGKTFTTKVNAQLIRKLAESHLQLLKEFGGDAVRVTDKMPDNFAHLDFIYALFPKARVIHCRRDPVDTCLSCFFQNFRAINFATTLEDIAFYYKQYERLMEHWRKVVPLPMYEVVYEELVDNQEAISRELVQFIGLDWDDRCLQFHETDRPIQTASKFQVRQPIYDSSIGIWKNYERELAPLMEILAPIL